MNVKNGLIIGIVVVIIIVFLSVNLKEQKANSPSSVLTTPGQNSQADCIKEGNRADTGNCCPGLRRIFVAYYNSAESCEELSRLTVADGAVYYVCSNCGNKVCEQWENRCNCPLDCKSA